MKDGKNYVCVKMIYVRRECGEGHMAGFLVFVLMMCANIKSSKSCMAGFIGGILCTSAYRCIFVCSVV